MSQEVFKASDIIIKQIVQSTMGKKKDTRYKINVWTQYPNKIICQSLLRPDSGLLSQAEEETDEGRDVSSSSSSEEEDYFNKVSIEEVPMIQNSMDYIFYVVKKNSLCHIMEGNPRDPNLDNHSSIFKIKAEKCLALTMNESEQTFFFMDENKLIQMLKSNENSRHLQRVRELAIVELQRLDYKPGPYEAQIISDKYAIYGSKIFYLYDVSVGRYPNGLLEYEDLIEEKRGN